MCKRSHSFRDAPIILHLYNHPKICHVLEIGKERCHKILILKKKKKNKTLSDENIYEFPYSFVFVFCIFNFKILMIILLYILNS